MQGQSLSLSPRQLCAASFQRCLQRSTFLVGVGQARLGSEQLQLSVFENSLNGRSFLFGTFDQSLDLFLKPNRNILLPPQRRVQLPNCSKYFVDVPAVDEQAFWKRSEF